jgi:hypothetical protein
MVGKCSTDSTTKLPSAAVAIDAPDAAQPLSRGKLAHAEASRVVFDGCLKLVHIPVTFN